jgi:hypothetical protein
VEKVKHMLRGKEVEAYKFKKGDKVVAWDQGGRQVIGIVKIWQQGLSSWGGVVTTNDNEDFYPNDITCLRPLTPLEELL